MSMTGIPESVREEHEEIFSGFRKLSKENSRTGKAVRELLKALEPHFEKEDEVAMPLLGAVARISKGQTGKGLEQVILLQERLANELDTMVAEHKTIGSYVASAEEAAEDEKNSMALSMLGALEHHAKMEEEVLYPAAMLAGIAAKAMKEAVSA
jgi:iron-sulfur cluster repair protein YtfE (RIC family)